MSAFCLRTKTVANVFPATAVLFANHSNCADAVSFRLYTVKLHDLISELEDPDLMYKMEVTSVLETVGNQTYSVPVEYLFENGPVTFPAGTMMIDLIDIDDERVTDERKQYTLEHMSKSGELAYNADKYAVKAMGGEDALVGAQGVLTLWILGPFSIPLYPPFIVCCAFSLLIFYTIQPFVFCCII